MGSEEEVVGPNMNIHEDQRLQLQCHVQAYYIDIPTRRKKLWKILYHFYIGWETKNYHISII